MAKVGRKTEAQKQQEQTKLERRKKLQEASEYIVTHFNLKKPEIEKKGPLGDRWYEIFEQSRSKNKLSIALYEPGEQKKAIKISTYKEDGIHNLEMDLWTDNKTWDDFIDDSKKYFAFIRRNK